MLGRPIPAPKPRSRAISPAVEKPSSMAWSTSGIPGPESIMRMVMWSMAISTSARPPSAWITMLISPSYMQMAARRMVSWGRSSFLRAIFILLEASPAPIRSPPST